MSNQTEADLSCPVCQGIFSDPVVLLCSHSFCKACLHTWWRGKPVKQCPVCKVISTLSDPPRNLALKNLCEAFLLESQQRESEPLCSLHSEKLKLFCLDHQELVCLVCRDSKTHDKHRIRPVDEAAADHREELRKSLKPVQEKLDRFKQAKEKFDQTADHIQVQAQSTERRIRQEFKKLRQFLKEEEESRLAALREEEEQKSRKVKEKTEALSREISALSDIVTSTEKQLRAGRVSLLQNYKTAVETLQHRPLLEEPRLPRGALINVVQHLGNLGFNIWKQMEQKVSYSPMILDPNTAAPGLIVCDDLTTVRPGETQKVQDNPERVKHVNRVLGSEDFKSGTHCWDVDVRNNNDWSLGVMRNDFGGCFYRELRFSGGKYTAVYESHSFLGLRFRKPYSEAPSVITVNKKLQRVRVHLDCDKEKVSFFDPETNSHLHTWECRKWPLFEKFPSLHPSFRTSGEPPLRILPVSVSPTVEKLSVPPSGTRVLNQFLPPGRVRP